MANRNRLSAVLATLALSTIAFALPAASQDAQRSGTFTGASGHTASGSVSIVQDGDGYSVVFADDYSLDSAPDPYVSVGSANAFAEGTDFALMSSLNGQQSYDVPANIDPTQYEAVWVWCRQFGVPLAVAELE